MIGLACIPVNDIPDEHPALARRPVAAAVLTLVEQDEGHRWINTICVSDARKSEIPLPHLLDKTLLPGVIQIASAADRMTLAMDAISRRFFVEPALAELCFGETAMLARYPRLTTDENARLLALLPSIPLLDTAIIMADEHLSKKLDALCLAHRDAFAARWSRLLPVTIVLALSVLGLLSP